MLRKAWTFEETGHNQKDEGEDQIAGPVFERARALYFRKMAEGEIRNPCYFAMDATRPHALSGGRLGKRFYIICEAARSFHAIPAGHGGGRDLQGVADFSNGRRCAKNFSNAIDSKLTAGGDYITGDAKTSFKGYYQSVAGRDMILERTFLFDQVYRIRNGSGVGVFAPQYGPRLGFFVGLS